MGQRRRRFRARPPARDRAGFTLIEIIAVVAIMAMVFGIGLPRLGRTGFDSLENEAENIAQSLRFARQRAVMTGAPHRLLIDLEEGGYLVEWYVTETRALGRIADDDRDLEFSGAAFGDEYDNDGPRLDLVPLRKAERDFFPIRHQQMGSFRWLDEDLYFVGAANSTGWVESGDYSIIFYDDGTTEPTQLELADGDDRHLTLEIEAILQQVRLREGGVRS